MTATSGAAPLLGGLIASRACLFLVGAETVDQIAKMRAWAGRTAALRICSGRLELHQRVSGVHPRALGWIKQFQIFGPHQLDVANGAGTVE